MHGERLDKRIQDAWGPHENDIYPPGTGLDTFFLMHEIVLQMAQDLDVVIDYLGKESCADTSRLGVTGVSMGAFAAFYLAANKPQIGAAAPMIGIPAFSKRWQGVVLETSSYDLWAEAMASVRDETARRTAFMREIDPFEKLESFCPKPLLMISGDQDVDSLKIYSVELYRALKPLYAQHPDRLKFNIHDGVDHRITSAMLDEVCGWFEKYLLFPAT